MKNPATPEPVSAKVERQSSVQLGGDEKECMEWHYAMMCVTGCCCKGAPSVRQRGTLARLLRESGAEPMRRYRRQEPRPAPVATMVRPYVEQWLAENEQLARMSPKQQWTAHRM